MTAYYRDDAMILFPFTGAYVIDHVIQGTCLRVAQTLADRHQLPARVHYLIEYRSYRESNR